MQLLVFSPTVLFIWLLYLSLQSMIVFFNPVKFGVTFTLGNAMALGRSVALFVVLFDRICVFSHFVLLSRIVYIPSYLVFDPVHMSFFCG